MVSSRQKPCLCPTTTAWLVAVEELVARVVRVVRVVVAGGRAADEVRVAADLERVVDARARALGIAEHRGPPCPSFLERHGEAQQVDARGALGAALGDVAGRRPWCRARCVTSEIIGRQIGEAARRAARRCRPACSAPLAQPATSVPSHCSLPSRTPLPQTLGGDDGERVRAPARRCSRRRRCSRSARRSPSAVIARAVVVVRLAGARSRSCRRCMRPRSRCSVPCRR